MKPSPAYLKKRTFGIALEAKIENERFWAHIRSISEELGYTDPEGNVSSHEIGAIQKALLSLNLRTEHVVDADGNPTAFGQSIVAYLRFRADLLNNTVYGHLMTAGRAKALFIQCLRELDPNPLSIPWNKQKGEKSAPAFLTGITNMVLGAALGESACDFDPLSLTSVILDREPFRTLARRVDGAYPSVLNPTAVWEIKEYYYTTTFGSRVADGIYETLLDGLELDGLEELANRKIFHYLILDARDTWWGQGNPYLCRIIDMLHMGYIDEAVFGAEVVPSMRQAANEWRRHLHDVEAPQDREVRVPPPPRHKRLSPSERRKKARKWNAWRARMDCRTIWQMKLNPTKNGRYEGNGILVDVISKLIERGSIANNRSEEGG